VIKAPAFISEKAVAKYLNPHDANRLVHFAFKALGQNKVQMPSKTYLIVPLGDFRSMPIYLSQSKGMVAIECFNSSGKSGLKL